jgi:uncharacterized protein
MQAVKRSAAVVRFISWTLALLICAGVLAHAALTFPPLTGRVVDEADILNAETRQNIATISADAERRTSTQIVVATVKSLQGVPIEDYGYQLGRAWGIGQKGKNNGVLLLVAPNDREVRIEVGYGLEGDMTDAQSKAIIERVILPRFRTGDFNAGVLAGAAAIFHVITGEAPNLPQGALPPQVRQTNDNDFGWLPILIFFVLFIFGRGMFWPMLFMGGLGGLGRGRGGYSGGGYSGGGFSDGGGFSGGGGSFGGGGASGKW